MTLLSCLCLQVSRHLSKLFDSLAKLKFKMSPDKKPLKAALGMFSKEEEYVPLDQECDLSGQVSEVSGRALGGGAVQAQDRDKPAACAVAGWQQF